MTKQCEWCLGDCDEDNLTQDVVCDKCKDKAADYEILLRDKRSLELTLKNTEKRMQEIMDDIGRQIDVLNQRLKDTI